MHWFRRHPRGRPPHPDVLTPAEWRVLELVREGRPNAEIAVRLGITVPTVKTHVTRILAKTGARDRDELARWDGRPSEASRDALGHGLAPPLLGWLTASGAGAGAKVAAGLAASAIFIGGLFAAYVFFFAEPDPNAAMDARLASPDVVAIIDGLEVSREEWQLALPNLRVWDDYQDCWHALPDEAFGGGADARELSADLLDPYPREVIALANLLVARTVEAAALERGLEPTDQEVEEVVQRWRDRLERWKEADVEGFEHRGLLTFDARINAVGEDRYWREVRPVQERRWLSQVELLQREGADVSPMSTYGFELARNADVHLGPELRGLSLDDVMEFLDAYEELIQLSERGE